MNDIVWGMDKLEITHTHKKITESLLQFVKEVVETFILFCHQVFLGSKLSN